MTLPLVSIIIPVYNSATHVSEAVQSALGQTWQNIEIILIDDGSTDNSLSIIQSFAADNVKVLYQTNKGASLARNRGLHEASGEFIQYLDADDLLSPNKIEDQMKLLQLNKDHICTCGTVHFLEDEDPVTRPVVQNWMGEGSSEPLDFLIKLYGGDLIGPGYGGMVAVHSWLCSRAILDTAGRWDEKLSMDDDGEYFCRVILASKGIVYAKNAVCYYRQYIKHKSLSALLNTRGYQSMLDAIDLKYKYMVEASHDKVLVDKIFGAMYAQAAITTYPHFPNQSNYAKKKANALGLFHFKYRAGPISNFLTKIFGWRVMRRINYVRHKL